MKETLCLIDPFEHLLVMMKLKHDLCSTPAEMLRVCSERGGGVGKGGIGSHAPSRQGDIQICHNHCLNSIVKGTRSICLSRRPICSQVDVSPLKMISSQKPFLCVCLCAISQQVSDGSSPHRRCHLATNPLFRLCFKMLHMTKLILIHFPSAIIFTRILQWPCPLCSARLGFLSGSVGDPGFKLLEVQMTSGYPASRNTGCSAYQCIIHQN